MTTPKGPKRKLVKIALERITRTDLICASCGGFRTEWAILPGVNSLDSEPMAGLHTKCIDSIHVRKARRNPGVKTDDK